MIRHQIKQYKIFKDTGFSTKDSIRFTYHGMMIDLYFISRKLKRKFRSLFK